MKRPHAINGFIEFGSQNSRGQMIAPKSRIDVSAYAGLSDRAIALFNDEDTPIANEDECPRRILQFNPPPIVKFCKRESFREITMLNKLGLEIGFTNVRYNKLGEVT